MRASGADDRTIMGRNQSLIAPVTRTIPTRCRKKDAGHRAKACGSVLSPTAVSWDFVYTLNNSGFVALLYTHFE